MALESLEILSSIGKINGLSNLFLGKAPNILIAICSSSPVATNRCSLCPLVLPMFSGAQPAVAHCDLHTILQVSQVKLQSD